MNKDRINKLESAMFELASSFLIEQVSEIESDFWIINITWVKLSSDLSYLDIYVSAFKNQDILTKTLANYAKDIQRFLWQKMSLRIVPRIRFRYDDAGEIAQDVTIAINKLK